MMLMKMVLMKHFFVLTFYFLRALAMLVKPGGIKSLAAENIILRKQLIILNQRRKRASVESIAEIIFCIYCYYHQSKTLIKNNYCYQAISDY